ncbi:MAG: hypothetical protein Q9208_001748 [Pyrenodesmia sp. 3 TL-2023]
MPPLPPSSVHNPSEALADAVPSQDRKQSVSVESLDSGEASLILDEAGSISPGTTEKRHAASGFIGIVPPPLVYPKSIYVGQQPCLPLSKERLVLKDILDAEDDRSNFSVDDFVSVDLEDFSVYRHEVTVFSKKSKIYESNVLQKSRSNELVSLNELNSKASESFFLDGIIRFGKNGQYQRYVQKVPFETLSIGAYEDATIHTVGADIWLQSVGSKGSNIWYRLRRPAPEYRRYHEPFLWLADLAKHIVDYLRTHREVRLQNFKKTFSSWLHAVHGSDQDFSQWLTKHPKSDFRQVVTAHATFLYNQAGQLGTGYSSHPLWGEIDPVALDAIPRQPEHRLDSRTVVTPYVYQCFSHLPWAKLLDPLPLQNEPQKSTEFYSPKLGALSAPKTQDDQDQLPSSNHARVTSDRGEIRTGDVVAIASDTNTAWRTKDDCWYGYVQGRKSTKRGHQLHLIWIYRPTDTACQDMRYPYANEVFLSDHCNCGDGSVYASEVSRKVRVELFGSPETDAEFFIRQKYSSADAYWATLHDSDFRCGCYKDKEPLIHEVSIGDTYLVKATSSKETLEPVVLHGFPVHRDSGTVLVRRLLRKYDDYGDVDAAPNELVYSSRIDSCDTSAIVRRCHIRFYKPADSQEGRIPAPYNRKGTGDCYYVISKENDSGGLEAIGDLWPAMNQGFDPTAVPECAPMRGLDIFCGGGNLGRGLEEGGAVKMEWAVDYFNEAIHTYHANSEDCIKLYNGSVNDYLSDAIHGRRRRIVAQKGEVLVICAGSPCQGFSLANRLYMNEASMRNISLVASVVAFVDFYRPRYVVMENVLGMATCSGKSIRQSNSNVFAQVLCALVGLGYQVRSMLLDSWNFGAPQSRSRLFITATAPGFALLNLPAASHAHPDTVIGRALGKTANGLPFGAREWIPTPFEYVTIGEATNDLPDNPDGRTACISCPDHRVTKAFSALDNVRLSCVPRFPPGMTFVKAAKLGYQPPPQMAAWHWGTELRANIKSKAWQRAKSNALLPTVTTENAPNEALTGSALHWDANRQLSVMEARRAQGYPDEEIIIGTPGVQWKIVGNSVTRQVAIALGLSIREAWLANGSSDIEWQTQPLLQEGEGVEDGDDLQDTLTASGNEHEHPEQAEAKNLDLSQLPISNRYVGRS